MSRFFVVFFLLSASFLPAPQAASAVPMITISTVYVGNAGNAPDFTNVQFGAVPYDYRIGTTEVTNAQYAAFLNAKAASDPFELFNTNMEANAGGGIARTGSSGSYSYTVKPHMGDKPVNFVTWYDSIRFANWLNNGQGAGDTESGAYTLLAGTPATNDQGALITRNSGATWFLPSHNEWYKAAYHQPAAQGGDSDNYWLYPTASNSAPTIATANAVGDISNPGANVANYNAGAVWNGLNGNLTTVGSAGPLSYSYYGTADQGGNVWEWNETLFNPFYRGFRGGSSQHSLDPMKVSWDVIGFLPDDSAEYFGFRVATVPEPSTALLAIVGCGLILWRRKKRK